MRAGMAYGARAFVCRSNQVKRAACWGSVMAGWLLACGGGRCDRIDGFVRVPAACRMWIGEVRRGCNRSDVGGHMPPLF